jgi:hypothetical protein
MALPVSWKPLVKSKANAVAINSTGKVGTVASGKQILGVRTANSTVSATTTVRLMLDRPHLQGRVT